ncbi:signal peptidase II [Sphingomonas bacterium]|uniref:signal peptidase II n=1 Tax=Sphingomonas bacterium TaxID=1895847 RepID=UPI0020C67C39|nr:signal peptidase II [Sphingomonas bacterium]
MSRVPRLGLLLLVLVLGADQLVKWYVTGPLDISMPGDARTLLAIFDLRFSPNVGVSLGLLRADSATTRWALVALTGTIGLGVLVWMWRERGRVDQAALGCVAGGALGNILDRVRLGYVTDYADLHFGSWEPFLVFNLADAAITLGVLVLLVRALLIRDGRNGRDRRDTTEKANG